MAGTLLSLYLFFPLICMRKFPTLVWLIVRFHPSNWVPDQRNPQKSNKIRSPSQLFWVPPMAACFRFAPAPVSPSYRRGSISTPGLLPPARRQALAATPGLPIQPARDEERRLAKERQLSHKTILVSPATIWARLYLTACRLLLPGGGKSHSWWHHLDGHQRRGVGIKCQSNGKENGLRVAQIVSEVLDLMFERRGVFWVCAVLIDLAFLLKIIVACLEVVLIRILPIMFGSYVNKSWRFIAWSRCSLLYCLLRLF